MSTTTKPTAPSTSPSDSRLTILIAGDVVALLLFVIVGRLSHQMDTNWFINVARIATPFLLGWFTVGIFAGAFRTDLFSRPGAFLLHSAVTWLLGIGLGLAFRRLIFGDGVPQIFMLVTLTFTGLFLLVWRAAFIWWARRKTA